MHDVDMSRNKRWECRMCQAGVEVVLHDNSQLGSINPKSCASVCVFPVIFHIGAGLLEQHSYLK